MTRHYPDLGSASHWSCRVGNLLQPIRSTTQIWVIHFLSDVFVAVAESETTGDNSVFQLEERVVTVFLRNIYRLFAQIYKKKILRKFSVYSIISFTQDNEVLNQIAIDECKALHIALDFIDLKVSRIVNSCCIIRPNKYVNNNKNV